MISGFKRNSYILSLNNSGRDSPKEDISALENKHVVIPDEIFTLEFNVLSLDGWLLPIINMHIFKTFIERTHYKKVHPHDLREFIIEVCNSYLEVPYHNLYHATNILHTTYLMLQKNELIEILNPDVVFGTLIAALVHDIGHPGNNNVFEINTFSELALKYNDLSVLEQHHCALAFELIKKHNIKEGFNDEEFRIFRKTIINCILGTDMSHHKSSTDVLKLKENKFNIENLEEQILLSKTFIHGADIGNPIQNNEICEEWSVMINQEFYNQSNREKELGLTLTYQIVDSKLSFYSNEIKYIKFICKPYWEELTRLYPVFEFELKQINKNLQIFTEKYQELDKKNFEFQVEHYS